LADRAEARIVDGRSPWPVPDDSVDRVLAVYLLDMFSPEATGAFFAEVDRVLRPGGLIAVGQPDAWGALRPARRVGDVERGLADRSARHRRAAPADDVSPGLRHGRHDVGVSSRALGLRKPACQRSDPPTASGGDDGGIRRSRRLGRMPQR
jgi:SAM-dependent methyltransferase